MEYGVYYCTIKQLCPNGELAFQRDIGKALLTVYFHKFSPEL